jgi:predicted nuclease with TOPRIM domain
MAQFEPWMIPIIAGVPLAFTFQVVQYKLKKKELEMRGSDAELRPEVDALRDDLDNTQAQLAEVQERLDFAERLLTAGRESQEDRSG